MLHCFLTQGKNQLLFPFQEEGFCNSYLQGWDNEPKHAYFFVAIISALTWRNLKTFLNQDLSSIVGAG